MRCSLASRLFLLAASTVVLLLPNASTAGTIDPTLAAAIKNMKPGQPVNILVSLSDRVDLSRFGPGGAGRHSSSAELVQALLTKAATTQGPVLAALTASGGRSPTLLWATNGIATAIPHESVSRIAQLPQVETVRLDSFLQAPVTAVTATSPAEWNVQMIQAPQLWAAGKNGTGMVVASLDTGVDALHADLAPAYRGGSNSWYDPYGQHATPADVNGHGTQTMGLMVGGSTGGTAIGVAPGAKWIAAKIFNDSGQATLSAIHQAFQWVLDPDGNPSTADAPDIVNNSWGFPSLMGACYTEFATDVAVLRAAGIEVVFAAGNDGPALGSSESPANNAGVISVGAIDQTQTVAPFSSRGPNACDGSTFPKVTAPGVSVKTSDLTLGGTLPNNYSTVSGTSFAAPHVAGGLALLWAAHPTATLATLESALEGTCVDLGILGPDSDYGYGLPDLVSADAILAGLPAPPVASPDSYAATAGTTLVVSAPGVLANDTSPSGRPLTAVLVAAPSSGVLTLSTDGSFTYVAPSAAGSYSFAYEASDGVQWSAPATATITVQVNTQPPVANPDSYAATAGTVLNVPAPGVLGNDSSPSGSPLSARLVSGPSKGSLSFLANGSFAYKASGTAATRADSFSYEAFDGTLASAPATVVLSIAAHPAPVAVNDSASTTRGTAVTINVIANDSDPDGSINPATVRIVSAPGKATASAKPDGTVVYTPSPNFTGTDTFKYTVKDDLGIVSNQATVTVVVN